MPRQKPREIAARLLREWEREPIPAETLLTEALPQLSGPDRGLSQELVLGVIRHRAWLDWLVDQKTDGRRQQPLAQILLRLGLYQIFQLDRVPDLDALREAFLEENVWIRPFDDVVYLMPPFVISKDELDTLTSAVCRIVERWSRAPA